MTEAWADWVDAERERRQAAGLWRQRSPRQDQLLSFADNDYLGLSRHPELIAAAKACLDREGLGLRSSALLQGRGPEHEALEAEIATFEDCAAALLFPSGFAANLSLLAALADDRLEIFSDRLNHASIVDGCRLARCRGAEVEVYRHGDLEHLEGLLKSSRAARRLVITETLFSMDGDLVDLDGLIALRRDHDFLLVVDEAHATGVIGARGGGLAEGRAEVDLRVGTLSKAVGALGGFIAGSQELVDHLWQAARGQVFSTALPAPIAAAARRGLALIRSDQGPRERLAELGRRLGRRLGREPVSPIIPLVLGDAARALAWSQELEERGLRVPAIRPPTVPAGSSRLRISLSARHAEDEIDRLATALQELERAGR
ncbi:MAG: 8-amino-7-oxononanoate synthase [Planctomycetes bacterium]|nr:8-amino-7-oxononanoate synthase [Planctomycetota bacterium]